MITIIDTGTVPEEMSHYFGEPSEFKEDLCKILEMCLSEFETEYGRDSIEMKEAIEQVYLYVDGRS